MSADLAGWLIVTWPKATDIVMGSQIVLTDAASGKQIVSALNGDLMVRLDPREIVTVELTMLVDANGKPLPRDGRAVVDESGENLRTGSFVWGVAEMRIADE